MARFSMATNETFTGRTGRKENKLQHNVVALGQSG